MSIVISESTRTASLQTRKVKVDVWVIIFFFTVCEIDFSGFIKALDSKGKKHTLKKVLREPNNALTLRISLSLRDRQ